MKKAVFGYRRRLVDSWLTPYELLYGVKPKTLLLDASRGDTSSTTIHCPVELLGEPGLRPARIDRMFQGQSGLESSQKMFNVGGTLSGAYGAVSGGAKWPAFQPRFSWPSVVTNAFALTARSSLALGYAHVLLSVPIRRCAITFE